MAETLTPHYSWIKPDIGGDASTWGNVLNQTIDAVDSVVYANQQAGVPIGSITMFGGATAPANWLLCRGQSLSTTGTYAALFAVLGYAFGGSGANFNLPNFPDRFPIAVGSNALGSSGGNSAVALATANLPPHAHPITDVAHGHTINQNPHTHTDAGHGHPDAGSYQDAHHHTVANVLLGSGVNIQPGSGFNQVTTATTSDAQPALHIGIGAGVANIQPQNAQLSLNTSGTNLSTTQNTGSGTPLTVVPPFLAINFIIRYQ